MIGLFCAGLAPYELGKCIISKEKNRSKKIGIPFFIFDVTECDSVRVMNGRERTAVFSDLTFK